MIIEALLIFQEVWLLLLEYIFQLTKVFQNWEMIMRTKKVLAQKVCQSLFMIPVSIVAVLPNKKKRAPVERTTEVPGLYLPKLYTER